jgi:GDP-D-mannose dehydratase
MTHKSALICGVSGQDGSYLAQLLLNKGYTVWGTSRDMQGSFFGNLKILGIRDRIKLISMVPEDFRSVYMAIKKSNPDEVYYLAGQSSVGLSFEQPAGVIPLVATKRMSCFNCNWKCNQPHDPTVAVPCIKDIPVAEVLGLVPQALAQLDT